MIMCKDECETGTRSIARNIAEVGIVAFAT